MQQQSLADKNNKCIAEPLYHIQEKCKQQHFKWDWKISVQLAQAVQRVFAVKWVVEGSPVVDGCMMQ